MKLYPGYTVGVTTMWMYKIKEILLRILSVLYFRTLCTISTVSFWSICKPIKRYTWSDWNLNVNIIECSVVKGIVSRDVRKSLRFFLLFATIYVLSNDISPAFPDLVRLSLFIVWRHLYFVWTISSTVMSFTCDKIQNLCLNISNNHFVKNVQLWFLPTVCKPYLSF